MIVARRPCTIYDVDVIGAAVLAVIALAAAFGVILPAGGHATEYRDLSASVVAANDAVDHTGERLRGVNRETKALQEGVAGHMLAAPKPGALTPFLQRVASLANRCDLRIMQVLPRPAQPADGYLTCDVAFTGRGRSLDFARLIHELSWDNPYFSLREFSIKAPPNDAQPACELTWTLRFYMLEDSAQQPRPADEPDREGRP